MILAGDIGGTKVNLGLFESGGDRLKLAREASFASRRYVSLQDIIREFLAAAGAPAIESACFGIAGPVRQERVQVTNLPWKIEAAELSAVLKITAISLINDLEANSYGLAELPASDFSVLNPGEPGATGNAAILAAGTGLGEAGLYWDGTSFHPFACEGGHSDFAPQNKLDAELFEYLAGRFGRVSWERVLSGSGLFHIYEFLRDTRRGDEPETLAAAISQSDPAAVITKAAVDGSSSRCVQALEMFISYYGAEAGNLGLKMMATGGVYLGGGIAPRILPQLQQGGFLAAFVDKAPMQALVKAMPVRVVLNPNAPLLGAAHYAAFGARTIGTPAHPPAGRAA
jgi:glucokinase